jgi:uncharacterized protein YkwD
MKRLTIFAAILAAYGFFAVTPAQPAKAENQKVRQFIEKVPVVRRMIGSSEENEVVRLVNIERQRAGLRPLNVSERLMVDARSWSNTQASRSRMYHSKMGYRENVAMGQRTPNEVVRVWMNSPGHRRNIMSPSISTIGVGLAYSSGGRPYWTQTFM